MTSLDDLERQVHDRDSFLALVRALAADWENEVEKEKINPSSPYGVGANGWQNGSIGAFLEAAVAWAEDMNSLRDRQRWPRDNIGVSGMSESPSWQAFARFLRMGSNTKNTTFYRS